jgi:hypothetical protein
MTLAWLCRIYRISGQNSTAIMRCAIVHFGILSANVSPIAACVSSEAVEKLFMGHCFQDTRSCDNQAQGEIFKNGFHAVCPFLLEKLPVPAPTFSWVAEIPRRQACLQ